MSVPSLHRRTMLKLAGALGFGLALPGLLQARASSGKAKAVIFLFMVGGVTAYGFDELAPKWRRSRAEVLDLTLVHVNNVWKCSLSSRLNHLTPRTRLGAPRVAADVA